MADFTQAAVTDTIPHQLISHANSVYGTPIAETDGNLWAQIHMHHAFIQATVNTDPASFYVQTTVETTDESWLTVAQFTVFDGTPVTEPVQETLVSIGETDITVASTTGLAANDLIYIQDVGTEADSEWHQLDRIVANTTIHLVDGVVSAFDSSDLIWSDAEHFSMQLDLSGIARWRVIYKNEGGTAADTAIWVRHIVVTDIV